MGFEIGQPRHDGPVEEPEDLLGQPAVRGVRRVRDESRQVLEVLDVPHQHPPVGRMRESRERHVDPAQHLPCLAELVRVRVRPRPDRAFHEVEHPQDSSSTVVLLDDQAVVSVDGRLHPLDRQLGRRAFEKAHRGGLQGDDGLFLGARRWRRTQKAGEGCSVCCP
ncbi:hypothetical protein [Saccharothrix sp. ALI-22-I]|uniref:hypothetical protein n=1 Tax=Saccharothrix sp. ALI-22-I TaxID=1933778 RepID=UPI0015C34451|nr:hypothetical protein [Saccharothrix sp. ALI-22-I]